jgi:hypothetical protein
MRDSIIEVERMYGCTAQVGANPLIETPLLHERQQLPMAELLPAVERRLLTNELTEGWEVAVDQRCVK